jgi:hypothetical protein
MMDGVNRVVARLEDGTTIKGTTPDFFPNRAVFHIEPVDGGLPVVVRTESLKALFFVRELAGDMMRRDVRGFIAGPGETKQGKKLAVLFKDGELVCGYSLSYSPGRKAFFMCPSDSSGNNLRVFVQTGAAAEIKSGPAADGLAQRVLAREAA